MKNNFAAAIARLTKMINTKELSITEVTHKRSWRDSEKIMTLASINEDIAALKLAIKYLKMQEECQA